MSAKLQIIDRILTWDFIIIGIENQRKWCKSTKNRQKTFHSDLFAIPTCQIEHKNYILSPMVQPARSFYFSMLTILKHTHLCFFTPASFIPKSHPHFWEKTLTHWGSFSYIMAKSCTHWSILSDFRKFLPHWGILCRWSFPEQSPLTVSVPCVFLFSLIFLRFALLWLSG